MMHIQNAILRFPLTPLAAMTISGQHILAYIPEPQLRTLLVLLPFDLGVADFLEIELRHLNHGRTHRQNLMHQSDGFQMNCYLVLNRRCKPAFRFLPVEKATFAIPCFSASSGTAKLATGGK